VVCAGEKVLDSMARPQIAIRGSLFVASGVFCFGLQLKRIDMANKIMVMIFILCSDFDFVLVKFNEKLPEHTADLGTETTNRHNPIIC